MSIQRWSENVILVDLPGEPERHDELQTVIGMLRAGDDCDVVLDFSHVDAVRGRCLADLLDLQGQVDECGHKVTLCGVAPAIEGLLAIARLDDLFEFAEDRFTALASLQAAEFGWPNIAARVKMPGGRRKIGSAAGGGSTCLLVEPEGIEADFRAEPGWTTRAQEAEYAAEERGRLRVVLADDHQVVRQGLASLLSEEPGIEVVGQASDGREAVDLVEYLEPDVVVMDVSMPVMSGNEATRRIKQDLPRTRIVALSMFDESDVRERMYQAGAESYVLKTAPSEELLAAICGTRSDS
jgi:CheY-like chemotaxis protein/anti-anti-sigma regulatory factor